jgi:hypothetical protein
MTQENQMNTEQIARYARIPDGTLIEFKQVGGQSFYNTGLRFKGELLWWTLPPGSPLEEVARKAMWELIHKDRGEATEKAASTPAQRAVEPDDPAHRAAERIIGKFAAHRTGYLGGLNEAIYTIIDEELRKG